MAFPRAGGWFEPVSLAVTLPGLRRREPGEGQEEEVPGTKMAKRKEFRAETKMA